VKFILKYIILKYSLSGIRIISRINNANDLILLILAVGTIRKDGYRGLVQVVLPYVPYQQADRDFALGECFSLQSICQILNGLEVDRYFIFDPHSDVSPALIKKCTVIDNSDYIHQVLNDLRKKTRNIIRR
jgi:ribose-phosphate pyrophosphokinase